MRIIQEIRAKLLSYRCTYCGMAYRFKTLARMCEVNHKRPGA